MKTPLISVITPCYNTGAYIPNLLNSVLKQTYSAIEMIVIDDGSTDNSADVIKSYIGAFEEKGYSLKYIYQRNQGQAGAIQNGLSHITGDYLIWPDSDDFYISNTAFEEMVSALANASEEVGAVRCQEMLVTDDPEHKQLGILGVQAKTLEDETLFEDCMLTKGAFYFGAGAYMVKTAALTSSTEMPIFAVKDAGQNWQLMLPVFFNYRCISICKPMIAIVTRPVSHSRSTHTFKKYKYHASIYKQTLLETLDRIKAISNERKAALIEQIEKKYMLEGFDMAIVYKDITELKRHYNMIHESGNCSSSIRLRYLFFRMRVYGLYTLLSRVYSKLRRGLNK